jgi:hypothetical protein
MFGKRINGLILSTKKLIDGLWKKDSHFVPF